ncbi:MAG: mevalonate kinase [Anaerolineaceae bacterium]|nr:mevalonate kinase [Anaerolineaceae bacterium]MBN2676449.1 mevalonate kinase [Anaerolineaceae bacterium]
MPAIYAYAPGKVILTGEHAVVYGRPAIAVPVHEVRVRAAIQANPTDSKGTVHILAPDISLDTVLNDMPADHPMSIIFREVQKELGIEHLPALTLTVTSTIPIAAGLGSGAAISVAISRVLSSFLGAPLPEESISRIAFETDHFYHGTPSGIDNTVISYGRMVFFIRGKPIEMLANPLAFTLVIADSGKKSLTGKVVHDLRTRVEIDPARYQAIFDRSEIISRSAREAIEQGDHTRLGTLLSDNHFLLQQLAVSTAHLDLLVKTAMEAGALGAKLSGAGCGGNIIALVDANSAKSIASALRSAGAVNTIITTVPRS